MSSGTASASAMALSEAADPVFLTASEAHVACMSLLCTVAFGEVGEWRLREIQRMKRSGRELGGSPSGGSWRGVGVSRLPDRHRDWALGGKGEGWPSRSGATKTQMANGRRGVLA